MGILGLKREEVIEVMKTFINFYSSLDGTDEIKSER